MNNNRIFGMEMLPRTRRWWMVLLLYVSYLAVGPIFSWPAVPDERDERVRDHAMARSYQVASGLLPFLFSWLSAAANGVHWRHPVTPGEVFGA